MDSRSGEPNSQHVLFCGDIVQGCDSVQIIHVAEAEKGKKRAFHRSSLINFCVKQHFLCCQDSQQRDMTVIIKIQQG